MDLSEQYVEMAGAAGEIQALHDLEHGDYYELNGKIEILYRPSAPPRPIVGAVWLPRQDQLQDMALPATPAPERIRRFFDWFYNDSGDSSRLQVFSLEQLWLCFTMKERWEKVWSDGRWRLG